MAENKTETLKKQLEEEKAQKQAQAEKEARAQADADKRSEELKVRVMSEKTPMWAGVIVFIVLFCLIYWTKDNVLPALIVGAVIGLIIWKLLGNLRMNQVARRNEALRNRTWASEIAARLYNLHDLVLDKAKLVVKSDMKESLTSISGTLVKIAEEVEADEKDRNKVRKLANYYGDMLLGLVDKYVRLQDNKDEVGEGANIENSMARIEAAIQGADVSLKKLLDSLFSDDNMVINAEVNTLDKLMKLELGDDDNAKKAENVTEENFKDVLKDVVAEFVEPETAEEKGE
ncbi:MAG: 5-bromo-4-chloroindolyl phosphate hydrolysis family protein [Clostridia bacterium]|nr:5-bromo-4-chloroindolyl phosphate hydrolysis family protein [Clostridia bacterium]